MASSNDKPLTGVRKRQQIQQANKAMLMWVAVAAAIVTICFVLGYNFVQRIVYNGKVISELNAAKSTLGKNLVSIQQLKTNVDALRTSQNLMLGNVKADPGDSEFQVIIDALPTENDRTALGASLQQKILSQGEATVEQISVTDSGGDLMTTGDSDNSDGNVSPTEQTVSFSFIVNGDYASLQQLVKDIERTIRPIRIDSISIEGTASNLQANVTATTYFVPKVDYQLGKKEVKP
jgi:Tfp pilus assembly protein PilO